MLVKKSVQDALERATRARRAMGRAFQEASVQDHEGRLSAVAQPTLAKFRLANQTHR
jgi:hypothetical protein